ncbi:hypothetical protein H0H93_013812, partial [Arthromyces matolae]
FENLITVEKSDDSLSSHLAFNIIVERGNIGPRATSKSQEYLVDLRVMRSYVEMATEHWELVVIPTSDSKHAWRVGGITVGDFSKLDAVETARKKLQTRLEGKQQDHDTKGSSKSTKFIDLASGVDWKSNAEMVKVKDLLRVYKLKQLPEQHGTCMDWLLEVLKLLHKKDKEMMPDKAVKAFQTKYDELYPAVFRRAWQPSIDIVKAADEAAKKNK